MTGIKDLFRWQHGRQESGYHKMLLAGATWPVKFDLYILKFPEGCELAPHTDNVEYGKHYRLNIVLKHAVEGGEFICDSPIYSSDRVKFFRPDLGEHSVSKVVTGNRFILSLGWVRN